MPSNIIAIEPTGRSPRARRVLLEHAEPLVTSSAVVKLLGLAEGDAWDGRLLAEAIAGAEQEAAKERALRMLGYRERSRHELVRGLLDDGYSEPTASVVVERLEELGLVDDARFAAAWATSRVRAGFDRRRVGRELEQKGIDRSIVARVLDEAAPVEASLERARASLRGRRASDRAAKERLVRRLVSRGFDLQTAIAAVSSEDTHESLT